MEIFEKFLKKSTIMKLIKYAFIAVSLLILVKCTPRVKTETSTTTTTSSNGLGEKELSAAQKKWADVKLENLKAGQLIYTTKCTKCHGANKITNYTEAQWEKLIAAMAPNAKLNTTETDDLTKYIYAVRESSSK